MALFNMIGSIFQASESRTDNGSVYYTPKESLTGRTQRRKLNKSDISSPTNFKHVTHVGFNAVPGFDARLDMDLKRLFNMAGIKEEHLQDQELSHKIFSVLEKAGSMEAVRKQTRRMTSVEKPSTRTRLHSLSSSSLTASKRQNCLEQGSPHTPKIAAVLARGSPLCYLQSLSKVPPTLKTPPPFSHSASMRPPPPIPPYLDELSQSFTPAVNLPVRHRSRKRSPPPQHLSDNCMKMPPPFLTVAKGIPSETGSLALLPSIPDHPCPDSKMNMVSPPPSLPHFDSSPDTTDCIQALFPSSIPCTEPPIKLGAVQSPPPLPPFAKLNSETITSCNPKECLIDPIFAAIPPPPPLLPLAFKNPCFENPLSNGLELSSVSEVKKVSNPASEIQETVASGKELERETNLVFLDQIKQGVQLKSVTQTEKAENTECSNIVAALMDVLKRRHKAIHSSDEDEVDEDYWED